MKEKFLRFFLANAFELYIMSQFTDFQALSCRMNRARRKGEKREAAAKQRTLVSTLVGCLLDPHFAPNNTKSTSSPLFVSFTFPAALLLPPSPDTINIFSFDSNSFPLQIKDIELLLRYENEKLSTLNGILS